MSEVHQCGSVLQIKLLEIQRKKQANGKASKEALEILGGNLTSMIISGGTSEGH